MIKYDVAQYNMIYIYAINDENHKGLLKIGKASFTSSYSVSQLPPNCPTLQQVAHERISQQTKTALIKYDLLYTELAVKTITMRDGSKQLQSFVDHDVHNVLYASNYSSRKFFESGKPSEWFEVNLETAKSAIMAVKNNIYMLPKTDDSAPLYTLNNIIKLRDEQNECVSKTVSMFKKYDTMLWDCKMRFGKTIAAYELINRQKYQKVIVVTHRPAVEDSWGSDHELMFESKNHKFIDKINGAVSIDSAMDAENDLQLMQIIKDDMHFVYFTSIQDLRGSKRVGGKYNKNNAVFDIDWDLVIVDEAHEGTQTDLGDAVIKELLHDNTKLLLLSGTPYNIISGFEENKYTWTYVDEQKAKKEWETKHPGEKNPYAELPTMNIFTFDITEQIPTSYRYVTEDSAFNFREFFRTWTGDIERDFRKIPEGYSIDDFVYDSDVERFLDLISKDSDNSNYPFSTEEYRDMFKHTFWIVPGVKEARALSAKLKTHDVFKNYEIVNIAGEGDKEKPYDEALALVRSSIAAHEKTITISCGKLTTGITVREWTGIMMLSGSSTTAAAGYMQAIFRVQSPGCIDGRQKTNCYVFDFAPDRALKVIAEVHNLTYKKRDGDDKARQILGEFINFCPVIAIEGTSMRIYDVAEMMRQIKRISVDAAISSGFEDDTIYKSDAGIVMDDFDAEILRKLSDVVVPQKKGKKKNQIIIAYNGLTDEKRKLAEKAKRKPPKERSPEEIEALEKYKKQKEEQKKMFNLLRAVSIRLPLLFYGAEADITEIIHLKDFVEIVDPESWQEFMPSGLKPELFLQLLKYYDEDVIVGAGLRIRKLAKAADELPPTLRAARIVEILSRFKNPDKETVLTPWRVVNMHMGDCIGGYNFFNEGYNQQLEEPRLIERDEITADILLNTQAKILELNSKSGLYPLYMAYSLYMIKVSGKEKDLPFEEAQKLWFETLTNNVFVLCKTKMARMITIRTLAGYTGAPVNAIYLTKLIERMQNKDRFTNKITNTATWNKEGEKMKFDAIVGNPPYQEGVGSVGNESLSKQLFPSFIECAISLKPRYVSLITPSRWFTADAQDKSFVKLRQFVRENNHFLKIFNYPDNKQLFDNVSIGSMNYFLYDSKYNGDVSFTECNANEKFTTKRPLFEPGLDIIISMNNMISIVDKIRKHPDFVSFTTITQGRNAFGIAGKASELEKITSISYFDNSLELRCAYEKICYIDKKYASKNEDLIYKWKVFTSKGNGGAGTLTKGKSVAVLGKAYIGAPGTVCTDSLIPIGCFDTQYEAESLQKYMSTKFLRFMVGVLKVSQNVYQNVYQFVPVQNFTNTSEIDWSKDIQDIDNQLYKKYNFNDKQIKYIEDMIKTME